MKTRFALAADTIEFQLGSKKEVRQLGHQLLGLLATSASVSVATRPDRNLSLDESAHKLQGASSNKQSGLHEVLTASFLAFS